MERLHVNVTRAGGAIANARREQNRRYRYAVVMKTYPEMDLCVLAYYRMEEVTLRAEQDREYQEAMKADMLMRERARKMEEDRVKAMEEEAQRELQAAIDLSKKLEEENKLRKKLAAVEASTISDDSPDIALIRFQLPQASKISKKFKKNDSIQVCCVCTPYLINYCICNQYYCIICVIDYI
jgi:hypothetical protein